MPQRGGVEGRGIGYSALVSVTKPAGERTLWQELGTVGRAVLPVGSRIGVVVVLLGLLITKVLETTGFAARTPGWTAGWRSSARRR